MIVVEIVGSPGRALAHRLLCTLRIRNVRFLLNDDLAELPSFTVPRIIIVVKTIRIWITK